MTWPKNLNHSVRLLRKHHGSTFPCVFPVGLFLAVKHTSRLKNFVFHSPKARSVRAARTFVFSSQTLFYVELWNFYCAEEYRYLRKGLILSLWGLSLSVSFERREGWNATTLDSAKIFWWTSFRRQTEGTARRNQTRRRWETSRSLEPCLLEICLTRAPMRHLKTSSVTLDRWKDASLSKVCTYWLPCRRLWNDFPLSLTAHVCGLGKSFSSRLPLCECEYENEFPSAFRDLITTPVNHDHDQVTKGRREFILVLRSL